ncbi:hypothetical protein [Flavobacterium cyclinae]|uniref:hypothetical protein n=1 Tax=Flavobacterium cyclinae TaxID=2895947 RepID=UPI001E3D836F|nr:hypothetical protein [Flavobacterium cyclinae]UGS21577.1 hypothetical protein LOS86_02825 [Flavobacterium cyclinae]
MKRLLHLFPVFMLTFFMWAIGVSYNASIVGVSGNQVEINQDYKDLHFSHFQTVEVEEGEFLIVESEPEFEVELDWFSIPTKSFNILQSSLKDSTTSYISSLFSSKETIPLYDLYCNWKFHLS